MWKLDEASGTRNDSFGSNHLSDMNSVGSATGKIGNAAQFVVATSRHLSIVDNANLSTGDIDFTILGWIKFDTINASYQQIFGKDEYTTPTREYWVEYDPTLGRITFNVSPDGTIANQRQVVESSLGTPVTGVWYFIVAWHDSVANTLNIQINDMTPTSYSYSGGVYNGTARFNIAAHYDNSSQVSIGTFLGVIDEVALLKRILSAGERTQLYNLGNGWEYPWDSRGKATMSAGFGLIALSPVPGTGTGSAAFGMTMSASGATVMSGSVSPTFGMSMSAAGGMIDAGSGSSAFVMSFTPIGGSTAEGTVSVGFSISLSAIATNAESGTATFSAGFTMLARGPAVPGSPASALTGLLDTILQHVDLSFQVKLFQTGTNPLGDTSTISDIVEADFNGYAAQLGTNFPPAAINLAGEAESDSTSYVFTQSADGAPQDIEGMYLSFFDETFAERLLYFQYFPTPITFAFAADSVNFSAKAFLANG